jgi:hypothetical protein
VTCATRNFQLGEIDGRYRSSDKMEPPSTGRFILKVQNSQGDFEIVAPKRNARCILSRNVLKQIGSAEVAKKGLCGRKKTAAGLLAMIMLGGEVEASFPSSGQAAGQLPITSAQTPLISNRTEEAKFSESWL